MIMIIKTVLVIFSSITVGIVIKKVAMRQVNRSTEIRKSDSKELKAAKERERLNGMAMVSKIVGIAVALSFTLGMLMITVFAE